MKNYSVSLLVAGVLLAGCTSKQGDAAPAVQQVAIAVELASPGSYVADVVMTRDYHNGQGPEAQVTQLAQHGTGHYTFTDYAPRVGYTYAVQLRIYPSGTSAAATSAGASLRGTITVDGNTRATSLLTTAMPTTSGNVRAAAMTVNL